jgi:hypothetical protein
VATAPEVGAPAAAVLGPAPTSAVTALIAVVATTVARRCRFSCNKLNIFILSCHRIG